MTRYLLRSLTILLVSSQAQANVVYNYVGNHFTSIVDNSRPAGTYDTSMRVTGFLELAAPLLAGMPLTDIGSPGLVLNFSFSDGRNSIAANDPTLSSAFHIGTNAAGVIDRWEWEVVHNDPIDGSGTDLRFIRSVHHDGVADQDLGFIRGCIDSGACFNLGQSDTGSIINAPGSWNIAPVPLPAAFWLLGSAIGAVGVSSRRIA